MSIVIENSSNSITSRIYDTRYYSMWIEMMRIKMIRNISYWDGSRLAVSGSHD